MAIHLRPVTLDDGKQIIRWRNRDVVREHCMNKSVITLESNEAFYHANIETGKYKQFIVEYADEDFLLVWYPIATVYLKDIDYDNKHCELCIFTSDEREWDMESQSLGIKILLDKAFHEYGMHKVYSYVFVKFPEEESLLKMAGFSFEALLREESRNRNGEYEDVLRMAIYNDN